MENREIPPPDLIEVVRREFFTAETDLQKLVDRVSASMTPPYYEMEGFTDVFLTMVVGTHTWASLVGAAAVMRLVKIKTTSTGEH